jgi:RNA-directed DNA polymerase
MTVIRYADDFVVLHPEIDIIEEAKLRLSEWLLPMGLELHPDKTTIRHTFLKHEARFEILRILPMIRNYPRVGKKVRDMLGTGLILDPTQTTSLGKEIRKVLGSARDVRTVVQRLQPMITGWSNFVLRLARAPILLWTGRSWLSL